MTIQEKIEIRKKSFSGAEIVSEWQQSAYLQGIKDAIVFASGNVEDISSVVHKQWMETKKSKGVESRKSEKGEELMVDYTQLSEDAKDLDRGTVKAVLNALVEIYFPKQPINS